MMHSIQKHIKRHNQFHVLIKVERVHRKHLEITISAFTIIKDLEDLHNEINNLILCESFSLHN
jgi:hypothetical protein